MPMLWKYKATRQRWQLLRKMVRYHLLKKLYTQTNQRLSIANKPQNILHKWTIKYKLELKPKICHLILITMPLREEIGKLSFLVCKNRFYPRKSSIYSKICCFRCHSVLRDVENWVFNINCLYDQESYKISGSLEYVTKCLILLH